MQHPSIISASETVPVELRDSVARWFERLVSVFKETDADFIQTGFDGFNAETGETFEHHYGRPEENPPTSTGLSEVNIVPVGKV